MKTIRYWLGVALTLSAFALKAATWRDQNGVVWEYRIESGKASIGLGRLSPPAISTDTVGDIIIPETLEGCPVTTVNASAFKGCDKITSIQFPPTIKLICGGAFDGCSNLLLTIPSHVTTLEDSALYGVSKVIFAEGHTTLNGNLFSSSWHYHFFGIELHLPSTITTVESFSMPPNSNNPPIQIETLYIKGPYRDFETLYASCGKIIYEAAYAEEWAGKVKWGVCDGSRLSVVTTQNGGTTTEKGRYVKAGEAVSVTAAAKEGYVFLGWDSDREGIEGTEETITFTMPQAPVTLVANFFPKALLEGWMDTRIDAKVDGERLMTADQAAEKTAAAIEGKVESGELFTPAGAEAKAAEEIAQKVANKELITADSLQEMALDAPVIEVDASGTAKVGISLQKARSLSGDWEEVALAEDAASVSAGALKLAVPAEEGTAFYKFVVPARQGAQEP